MYLCVYTPSSTPHHMSCFRLFVFPLPINYPKSGSMAAMEQPLPKVFSSAQRTAFK